MSISIFRNSSILRIPILAPNLTGMFSAASPRLNYTLPEAKSGIMDTATKRVNGNGD